MPLAARTAQWAFDDATFGRSAASLDNPDHVAIVIRNHRWRLSLAEGPVISVPTITLEGNANGAPHPDASAYATKFSGTTASR